MVLVGGFFSDGERSGVEGKRDFYTMRECDVAVW